MKVIHYINQFFGGIGGEDKADQTPYIQEGLLGPSVALQAALKGADITHTIICGDNFIGTNTDEATKKILEFLQDKEFDIFVAGPAFQAGRYGFACGTICKAVKEKFNVPVFSSMHIENPGVEMFKRDFPVFVGGKSAAKMKDDIASMAKHINKFIANETLDGAALEGYFPRGIREQIFRDDKKTAARRVVDMLIKKITNQAYKTEFIIPAKDLVPIADAVTDIKKIRIALMTTGGIVPVDNPDRIQSASATRWGKYDISNMPRFESGVYKTIHAGFDPAAANADPNVVAPLDVLKELEKEGKFASLHKYFYSTVGTGTTQAEAKKMAEEIIPWLREDNVDAIILVAT